MWLTHNCPPKVDNNASPDRKRSFSVIIKNTDENKILSVQYYYLLYNTPNIASNLLPSQREVGEIPDQHSFLIQQCQIHLGHSEGTM